MNLFEIAAALTLNSEQYEKGLANAEGKATSFGSKLSKGLGAAAGVAGAAITAVAGAATAVGTAMYNGIKETAEYGDEIDKMSQKLGISAEAYQEWDFILQHSGASIAALKPAMKTLLAATESNAAAFEALGLSMDDISSMSQEELFAATISALQGMTDETERTKLATDLLGKSGMELGALLNTSAEDTAAMKQQVHDLGGVMSDAAVKDAAAFQDSMQNLNTAVDGLKRGLLSSFMPSVTTVMDGLTQIFSGNGEGGVAMVTEGVQQITDGLITEIPKFLEIVATIATNVGLAIVKNAPSLVKSLVDVVGTLVNTLIENAPMLVNTVLDIVEILANSLGEMMPVLIPALVNAVVFVAETLIERLPDVLAALLTMVQGVAEGLIAALPILIDALPTILTGVISFLLNAMPMLITTGVQLLSALTSNIGGIIEGIVKALPQIIAGVITAIVDTFPEMELAGLDLFMALVEAIPEVTLALVEALPVMWEAFISTLMDLIPELFQKGVEAGEKLQQGLKDAIDKAKNWGKDLMENFISGIKEKFSKLTETVKGAAQKVKDFLGFSEPKEGPLSNFHTYAPDMIDLFVKGIRDNVGKIDDALGLMTLPEGDAATVTGGYTAGQRVAITQNIYAERMTPSEVFEEAREQQERWLMIGV